MTDTYIRAATLQPTTFKPDANTIEVIFSTGADVPRRDFQGPYLERFSMNPSDWDLSSLSGAPVLDNHDRFTGVRSILGVVESGTINSGSASATLRFGTRPEIQGLVGDIKGGIIRNVSFGYSVREWKETTENGTRVRTAFGIAPKEISFTAIGADPDAKTRSEEQMNPQTLYRNIAQAVGVPQAFADDLATRQVDETSARSAIIREAARLIPAIDSRQAGSDGTPSLVERMADGLRARVNPAHNPLIGREFANCAIFDLALRCLSTRGESTLGSRAEIITRAMHTTSDFPNVLAEYFNKELLQLRTSPSPITQLFKRASMTDFRARHIMEISDGSDLALVGQNGEVTFGTINDKELASYTLGTYAKGYSISFQALVNDDMAALSDLTGKVSRGARQWFSRFLVDTIVSNPVLADGLPVFDAAHGNLAASGADPQDTTIAAAKLAMRKQTDLSGEPINAIPKFILISAAKERLVDLLLANLYPQQPAEAIVSARTLTPIVEPRLDAKGQTAPWYVFADPMQAPVFEYAELSGYEGPRVEVRESFDRVGTDLRVVWHVGAGAIDSRGAFKNPGA